ncbi:hypothetical protein FRB94_009859 [Tulasnella sp. JGI-2019a]|nr:hypothetical protein FRB93_013754 [Tulasnella sp. JGI-2019a]KAG9010778.1 hypothetical protein FRB94_009859 [Tulasnella sp. JGI-2019a]
MVSAQVETTPNDLGDRRPRWRGRGTPPLRTHAASLANSVQGAHRRNVDDIRPEYSTPARLHPLSRVLTLQPLTEASDSKAHCHQGATALRSLGVVSNGKATVAEGREGREREEKMMA